MCIYSSLPTTQHVLSSSPSPSREVTAVVSPRVTWHRQVGETYAGHPPPASLFCLSECQTAHTRIKNTQSALFKGVASLHCWNVLCVCNSHCMSDLSLCGEIPQTQFPLVPAPACSCCVSVCPPEAFSCSTDRTDVEVSHICLTGVIFIYNKTLYRSDSSGYSTSKCLF